MYHHSIVRPTGKGYGSLCGIRERLSYREAFVSLQYTNGGEAISVVRVVVVDVTSRVLIPSIVRVVAVRATQAHILRTAYTLIIKTISKGWNSVYNLILSTRGGGF